MKQAKVIAVCNQKGGVGKTTTTINLGIGLANQGKKVLICDMDPQSDTTASLGWKQPDELDSTLANLLISDTSQATTIESAILHHEEGIDLLPANIDLSATELHLVNAMCREAILKNTIADVKDNYDYVLIDCPPALGMLTINSLVAADSVIIPVQAQYLPAKGMTQLLRTIHDVKRNIKPNLSIEGVVLTLVDGRTNLSRQVIGFLRENYGTHIHIFNSQIPMGVKVAESVSQGKSIYAYKAYSPVAIAYESLTKEVLHGRERSKEQER
ncbi:ParA family protein [Ohessyouella blattaphilus]|uniref:AAA family ATPase n=1 Tax=Ohessyouella blattaphilus TaxID=2949333 RepID=A0ABT1EJP6_9FIRM|nr:AAA family ATPase [Ohessyouella blattaphilus]MCP1110919.1 AAA family ATPase [Ohessyouella blattaphilus]MCR8564313.1 AAA family ATPase [Ohessyouella blattaphilus]